ncbi:MAG: hypothetical protein ACREJ0_05390 [Geminicoccaceae bacterium]
MKEVSWVETVLPELLWIALIQRELGASRGVALITTMARAARAFFPEERLIFGFVRDFTRLQGREEEFRSILARKACLHEVQTALHPLIDLYPQCPLGLVGTPSFGHLKGWQFLNHMRQIVRVLLDKEARETVFTQATCIWLAFDCGKMKVQRGLALAQFPEIQNYPETELSRNIASSIRAGINMFFTDGMYNLRSGWPGYFWNRGLELDSCQFGETRDARD